MPIPRGGLTTSPQTSHHLITLGMSAPHSSQPSAIKSRPRGSRVKDAGSTNGQQPAVRLKVVIRHIPSLLTETEFRALLGENINDDNSEYFRWEGGKIPEEFVLSRSRTTAKLT